MASLTERMLGAAKLDAATYEEVETDATATPQAMLVVVLANLAVGVAVVREVGIGGLLVWTLASLISWFVWAFVVYLIGTRLLPGAKTEADVGQLLRTIGFSAAPGVINILGVIPIPMLSSILDLIARIWMLLSMIVATRQALDYESTGRAIAVCAIGLALNIVVFFVLVRLFGMPIGVAP
jgi:hypothetical protein